MKRSEMLKILETRFKEIGLNITPSVLAESVMRMVEDAGMQPPNITLNELLASELTYIGQEKYYYACWEPETKLTNEEFIQKTKVLVDQAITNIGKSLEIALETENETK